MWEISIVTGSALAAALFFLRTRLRKLAAGNHDQYQYDDECSRLDSGCKSVESTLSRDFLGFAPDSLDQNSSSAISDSSKNLVNTMDLSACSLVSMEPGRTGTVLALTGGREFQAKLVSMGFNVGSEVKVLKSGVGGSGLLVATGDTRLAIGNGIAERIVVALKPVSGVD